MTEDFVGLPGGIDPCPRDPEKRWSRWPSFSPGRFDNLFLLPARFRVPSPSVSSPHYPLSGGGDIPREK